MGNVIKEKITKEFRETFSGMQLPMYLFSPGRVNLIGEHTDYNGGHVFPCALTIGTYGAVRKRSDRLLRFYSANFPQDGVIQCSLDKIAYKEEYGWSNYVLGVIDVFIKEGFCIDQGLDFYCFGTIPNKSGLSSSASLEVLAGKALIELFNLDISMETCALLCQKSENQFIGVACGIMDQFAIAMGKKDSAIFLDTAALAYEYAPIQLSGYKIVIGNTNKKRGLNDSKYNERRAQCEQALKDLQAFLPIRTLGDLSRQQFDQWADKISDPICRKRAKHAVYENLRTIEAVSALKAGDLITFGKLMNQSHISLRDDYEVTGVELDTLAEASWSQTGVIGARMTGAGFGGCTVAIVKEEAVDAYQANVAQIYKDAIGYDADFYIVSIGDGPSVLC